MTVLLTKITIAHLTLQPDSTINGTTNLNLDLDKNQKYSQDRSRDHNPVRLSKIRVTA